VDADAARKAAGQGVRWWAWTGSIGSASFSIALRCHFIPQVGRRHRVASSARMQRVADGGHYRALAWRAGSGQRHPTVVGARPEVHRLGKAGPTDLGRSGHARNDRRRPAGENVARARRAAPRRVAPTNGVARSSAGYDRELHPGGGAGIGAVGDIGRGGNSAGRRPARCQIEPTSEQEGSTPARPFSSVKCRPIEDDVPPVVAQPSMNRCRAGSLHAA
jgi:hypothetical protein